MSKVGTNVQLVVTLCMLMLRVLFMVCVGYVVDISLIFSKHDIVQMLLSSCSTTYDHSTQCTTQAYGRYFYERALTSCYLLSTDHQCTTY